MKSFFYLSIFLLFLIYQTNTFSQVVGVYPVAIGEDTTFSFSAAYSPEYDRYLIPIVGDQNNRYNLTTQLLNGDGSLHGTRVIYGIQVSPFTLSAWGYPNYLIAYYKDGLLKGQLVDIEGSIINNPFVIGENVDSFMGRSKLIFVQGVNLDFFVIIYRRNDGAIIFQRIDKNGNLLGSSVLITNDGRDPSIAFDGNKFLMVWNGGGVYRPTIYGRFVSIDGSLIGPQFIIDDSSYPSDNPVGVSFNGAKFLVVFDEEIDMVNEIWNLYGRFVSTNGIVEERIPIAIDGNKHLGFVESDGQNFLVTYHHLVSRNPLNASLKGKYVSSTGSQMGDEFVVFESQNNMIPFGGVVSFGNSKFLVVVNLGLMTEDENNSFIGLDVYGVLVNKSYVKVDEETFFQNFELKQNYPNPFNSLTNIDFIIPEKSKVSFEVYDVLGRKVMEIGEKEFEAGSNSIQIRGDNLVSGVYIYKLSTEKYSAKKKFILVK